jgi:hypothetical protein
VDDEDYYSDEEDQDPLGMDGSDDMCSFATEVDGWYTGFEDPI